MSPRLFCLLALSFGCFAAGLTGCVATADPAPQQVVDPFACPPGQCQPGQCLPGQCTPNQCPPGGCPLPRSTDEVQGIEIGVTTDPYPVNALAQNEVKSSDEIKTDQCLPCQPQAIYRRPVPQPVLRPQTVTPQTAAPQTAAADEVKQGRFQCESCKRPTVGEGWQVIWSDDGTSLLCLCKDCYAKSSPQQRESVMRSYLARHGIDPKKRPLVEATVIEASRGY